MKELTKSWTDSIQCPIKLSSSWPAPDLETSGTTSISSQLSTTGSTRTESTTSNKPTFEEPNFTPWVQYITQVCLTLPDSMLLLLSAEWPDGPGTTETPTWKSIFRNCHQLKSSRSSGTELQFLLEDSLHNKLSKNTSTPPTLSSTRARKLSWPQRVRLQSWCAQPSVLTWVAFQSLIWVTTMDTFVFATVQSMTSSVESDKDQPSKTCHTLITQFMRTELWSVSKLSNSQENHQSDSGLDLFVVNQIFYIHSFLFPPFLWFSISKCLMNCHEMIQMKL